MQRCGDGVRASVRALLVLLDLMIVSGVALTVLPPLVQGQKRFNDVLVPRETAMWN